MRTGLWSGGPRGVQRLGRRLESRVGGPARTRAALLLAAVLALNAADSGTIGAVAAQLERDLRIDHARLGLLSGMSAGVGAVASLPMGVLVDRTARVRLLATTVVAWAVAMAASGLARSYLWLLLARLALGAAVAAAGPAVASLVGDLFPPAHRGRIYSLILGGELVGTGVGLLASGDVAAVLSWRFAFFLLAALSLGLAALLWWSLPEPARGGASWIPTGARHIPLAGDRTTPAARPPPRPVTGRPDELPLRQALVGLLRIPTNRLLIIASCVGYFFFAGLRTFSVVFVTAYFGIGQSALSGLILLVGLGALAGVLAGGRITDALLARGARSARVTTTAVGYTLAAVLFAPGLATTHLWPAIALFTAAAAALSSANPSLDAARLDIVPATLWGRAEALRTVLRLAAEAVAPTVFGVLADSLGGSAGRAVGLRDAFLIMLLPLLVNGVMVWRTRRTYPSDVAAAASGRLGPSTGDHRGAPGAEG